MAALRQHADFLAGGELRQANGAVGELLRLLPVFAVGELRQRLQNLLLEAFVGRGSRRRRRIRRGCRGPAGEAADPGAARHRDEAEHADEGAEESGEDHYEVGVDSFDWG